MSLTRSKYGELFHPCKRQLRNLRFKYYEISNTIVVASEFNCSEISNTIVVASKFNYSEISNTIVVASKCFSLRSIKSPLGC